MKAGSGVSELSDHDQTRLRVLAGLAFSPGAPVDSKKLFAGRVDEMRRAIRGITARGRHLMMYGQRGVGKTSLATIFKELFDEVPGMRFFKINCTSDDGFDDIWRRAFREIPAIVECKGEDDRLDGKSAIEYRLEQLISDSPLCPGDIRRVIQNECQDDFELVLIFDEFDRLAEHERALFADTIKDLSDNSVKITIVLVGVARDVVELIDEHESIKRPLVQISLPPMARDELGEIIDRATNALRMTIEKNARDLIVFLSQGFPHYTHLLGQESALAAIDCRRRNIRLEDVEAGIQSALEESQESEKTEYHKAIQSQRKNTLYGSVLLACAMAPSDERGFFASADVREPMSRITGRDYDIPAFSKHLKDFTEDADRGPVLEKTGKEKMIRFRFRNPMLRPYVILKGLAKERIDGNLIDRIGLEKMLNQRDELLLFPEMNQQG